MANRCTAFSHSTQKNCPATFAPREFPRGAGTEPLPLRMRAHRHRVASDSAFSDYVSRHLAADIFEIICARYAPEEPRRIEVTCLDFAIACESRFSVSDIRHDDAIDLFGERAICWLTDPFPEASFTKKKTAQTAQEALYPKKYESKPEFAVESDLTARIASLKVFENYQIDERESDS